MHSEPEEFFKDVDPAFRPVKTVRTTMTGDTKATPIKANQVRVHTNKQGHESYYIVIENNSDTKGAYGALWFRNLHAKPMHYSPAFKPQQTDPVVMDNINIIRDTQETMHNGED